MKPMGTENAALLLVGIHDMYRKGFRQERRKAPGKCFLINIEFVCVCVCVKGCCLLKMVDSMAICLCVLVFG